MAEKSYFPLLIELTETGEQRIIEYTEIPIGETFKVLEIRVTKPTD